MVPAMLAGTGTSSRRSSGLRGHDTVAPDLPIEDDTAGLTEYATAVIDAIGDRRDVVVVAQSFGGYIAPIVAERIDARLIVLVAAMIPSPGESAEEMFVNTRWEPAQLEDSSELAVFYHDVPRELADEALSRGRRQSDTPGREPWPLAAWPDIETRFVLCRNDRFFPARGCEQWFGTVSASSLRRSTVVTALH